MKTYKVIIPFSGTATYITTAEDPEDLYNQLEDESFMSEADCDISTVNTEAAIVIQLPNKIKN